MIRLGELALTVIVAAVAILALPLAASTYTLTLLACYAMLALSLAFVWGYAGILCFGQAAFFGLGAYAFAITAINFDSPWFAFLASLLVPTIVAAALGAMMFYGRLSDVYMAVVTLVFTLILFKFMNTTAGEAYVIGKARLGGFNGIPGFPTLTLPWNAGEYIYGDRLYYFTAVLLLVVYILLRSVLRSGFGRKLVGIRENELRAELMGYDVRLLKTIAFAIGGAIAGLAGCLFANWAEIITPTMFSLVQSSEIIIWVIVGGAGTLVGPMIGAGALGWLKIALGRNPYLDNFLVMGIVLILAVLLLPRGIMPVLVSAWKRLASGRARARPARRRAHAP
jgi:branched-chain amino acid transport system permease protein